MSKNVKVAGTSYTGVPAIILPLATGSGTAKFTDTSASTVTAERIVSGYGAYDSTGTWVDGTSPGENIVIDEVWSISGDTLFIDDGSSGITPTGTINITSNGTTDVTYYASANVNVPNSYSASDEGKVVSSGALVSQGSDTVTQNGVIDTTLISSLTVNVPTGGISWDDIASRSVPSGDIILTVTSIGDYAFAERRGSNTWRAFCPDVTTMGQNAFRNCTYLTEVHLPKLSSYSSTGYAFYGDTRLQIVDYGVMSTVRANTFTNCTAFNTLILRKSDAISALAATATFTGTCFKSGGTGGTIYIPKALYDHLGDGTSLDYKAATNWSTVDGYGTITWAKIEGSAYELS